jgi:hypothetical protein
MFYVLSAGSPCKYQCFGSSFCGNRTMTNESDRDRELHQWYSERRRAIFRGEAGCGAEEELLAALKEKIRNETNEKVARSLKFTLAGEYELQERYAEAEATLLKLMDETPDALLPLISLASQKLYAEQNPQAAMPIIDKAIEIAYRTGIFRRLALGNKARIALALESYVVVEDVLRQLMDLRFGREHVDCGIERDFFDRLPAGVIDEEISRRYDEFSSEIRKPQRS